MLESKHMQNGASAAKRAATTLRNIAECIQSVEEKGVLLAAARIAETYGSKRTTDAKAKKRQEQAYEKFITKAKAEAEAKIRADFPMATTLQKVAIWSIKNAYREPLDAYLRRAHSKWNTLHGILKSEIDDAISEIASDIAYDCYRKKIYVSAAICEPARKVEAKYSDRTVIETAQRVDALLASETVTAEAA